ncbi:MAG: restriction endonuclease [Magnetococcus sp. DMHC-6]
MKFAYEDLSDYQFEVLVVLLCQRLLGISVQGFARGPDGGRDAKFVGTAELHPSKAAPWVGVVIVQAKHTNGYNRSFSESDFYSTSNCNTVIGKEVPRIKNLRVAKQLDHYMLFANRRLTANAEKVICEHIADQCGIPNSSIYLCGLEQLELWLKRFPEIAQEADLDAVDSPLIVSPDDLADVVQAFASQKDGLMALFDDPPTVRVTYEKKNVLNKMTAEYAKAQLRNYLKETTQICTFLAAPENIELMRMYKSVVDEFQLKIIAKRKNHQTFDEVMEHLVDLLFNRDPVLKAHKRLTRAVLFYMYWNCDIGEMEDVATDQTLAS